MSTVVLIGALDTKGAELAFARARLTAAGVDTVVVDVGVLGEPTAPSDISREEVAQAGGQELSSLVRASDRGAAVGAMARGAAEVALRLHTQGRLDGIFSLGGSAGATVATAAMRALPIGVPKLLVSTVAAGDTRPYVGTSDITLMYPVVDIAGLNRISRRVIAGAAGAMAGMLGVAVDDEVREVPMVAATMFGVTTPCVSRVQKSLEALGSEVLIFHATGTGGDAMESLVRDGYFDLVLDLTTTELADELAGGVCAAGPGRLDLTARRSDVVPRVVSLGALDMVNFGPRATVPSRYRSRHLYAHNEHVTLMRTNVGECRLLGERLAARLSRAVGQVAVVLPRLGFSAIDAYGQPFHDPDADEALIAALLDSLAPNVEVLDLQLHINDPAFADQVCALAQRFLPTSADGAAAGPVASRNA